MIDVSANFNMYSSSELLQQYLEKKAANNTVTSLSSTQSTSAVSSTDSSDTTSDFASILNEEVSNLSSESEMAELASVLDKTVLGDMDSTSLSALSEDLLGTSGGRNVLASLIEGQFTGMLFDSSDASDEDENSVDNTLSQLSDSLSSDS